MKQLIAVIFIFITFEQSHAENCEDIPIRILNQLTPNSIARTQLEALQTHVESMTSEQTRSLITNWEHSLFANGHHFLPGLSNKQRHTRFINLDYREQLYVLHAVANSTLFNGVLDLASNNPSAPLPEKALFDAGVFFVLLRAFKYEHQPFEPAIQALNRGAFFMSEAVPLELTRQLQDAYADVLRMSESQQLNLLTRWENERFDDKNMLPGGNPDIDMNKRFLEMDYIGRRNIIGNVTQGNYFRAEVYFEEHPGEVLPVHITNLFRIEMIMRLQYKPKFVDPLPEHLDVQASSPIKIQIALARKGVLEQPEDLQQRTVSSWENDQLADKSYLMGLDDSDALKYFSELSYNSQVNVLRSLATVILGNVYTHTAESPTNPLSEIILNKVRVYALLINHVNHNLFRRTGCTDTLQLIMAQDPKDIYIYINQIFGDLRLTLSYLKTHDLKRWEDEEFSKTGHLPGLGHNPEFRSKRFRNLKPEDQQAVVNVLAQRIIIQSEKPEVDEDPSFNLQVRVYLLLLEASRSSF